MGYCLFWLWKTISFLDVNKANWRNLERLMYACKDWITDNKVITLIIFNANANQELHWCKLSFVNIVLLCQFKSFLQITCFCSDKMTNIIFTPFISIWESFTSISQGLLLFMLQWSSFRISHSVELIENYFVNVVHKNWVQSPCLYIFWKLQTKKLFCATIIYRDSSST